MSNYELQLSLKNSAATNMSDVSRQPTLVDLPPIVLILGGSGYIGTHLMLELHGNPYQIAIVDIKPPSSQAIAYAETRAGELPVLFFSFDLETLPVCSATYPQFPRVPFAGIMLAALKDVSESERLPYEYIRKNNTLCVNSMEYLSQLGITRLIHASSAAVYADSRPESRIPQLESTAQPEPIGVYGYTKAVSESTVRRLVNCRDKLNQHAVILRYMNPIGSHPIIDAFSDFGICSSLARTTQNRAFVNRGNCMRDYIHITDLASFHTTLLKYWDRVFVDVKPFVTIFNVGNGVAVTVDEIVETFGKNSGFKSRTISYESRNSFEPLYTVGSMAKAALYFREWWNSPRRSLQSSVADYRRLMTKEGEGTLEHIESNDDTKCVVS